MYSCFSGYLQAMLKGYAVERKDRSWILLPVQSLGLNQQATSGTSCFPTVVLLVLFTYRSCANGVLTSYQDPLLRIASDQNNELRGCPWESLGFLLCHVLHNDTFGTNYIITVVNCSIQFRHPQLKIDSCHTLYPP